MKNFSPEAIGPQTRESGDFNPPNEFTEPEYLLTENTPTESEIETTRRERRNLAARARRKKRSLLRRMADKVISKVSGKEGKKAAKET